MHQQNVLKLEIRDKNIQFTHDFAKSIADIVIKNSEVEKADQDDVFTVV